MALSIKADEADELARQLTAITHESLTEAVTTALRERLQRLRSVEAARGVAARLDRLAAEYRTHHIADRREPDEILGYDEHGLAR